MRRTLTRRMTRPTPSETCQTCSSPPLHLPPPAYILAAPRRITALHTDAALSLGEPIHVHVSDSIYDSCTTTDSLARRTGSPRHTQALELLQGFSSGGTVRYQRHPLSRLGWGERGVLEGLPSTLDTAKQHADRCREATQGGFRRHERRGPIGARQRAVCAARPRVCSRGRPPRAPCKRVLSSLSARGRPRDRGPGSRLRLLQLRRGGRRLARGHNPHVTAHAAPLVFAAADERAVAARHGAVIVQEGPALKEIFSDFP